MFILEYGTHYLKSKEDAYASAVDSCTEMTTTVILGNRGITGMRIKFTVFPSGWGIGSRYCYGVGDSCCGSGDGVGMETGTKGTVGGGDKFLSPCSCLRW